MQQGSGQTIPHGGWLTALLRNQLGSVLPMSAVAIIVLVGMVGGGVDMGRAYQAQTRLQYACDAGVLAGRRAVDVNGFDSVATGRANAFFDTNFQESSADTSNTVFTVTSDNDGQTVQGVATTNLDTAVMQIFGKDQIALRADCKASLSVGNSDIMLVLDTTGSMACTPAMTDSECSTYVNNNSPGGGPPTETADSRMSNLRVAVKEFYDTVDGAVDGTNVRARFGFVPYTSTVNVGHLLDPSYLKDVTTVPSRRPDTREVVGYDSPTITFDDGTSSYNYGNWYYYSGTSYGYTSCQNNKPGDSGWYDDGSQTIGEEIDTNAAEQRRTTRTKTQPQTYDQYYCYNTGSGYRIITREISRNEYEYKITTEEPIFGPETGTFKRWSYENVAFDTSVYKTRNGSNTGFTPAAFAFGTNGASQDYTWGGCIEERATVSETDFSYSNTFGVTPAGALDLDIDEEPDSTDPTTQWAPLMEEFSYGRFYTEWNGSRYWTQAAQAWEGFSRSSACPFEAQQLAEMNEAAFDSYVDGLVAFGGTYHDIGMIWGGRLASPTGIFESNVTADTPNGGGTDRHLIFMTDGFLSPNEKSHTAYGVEYWDPRVTDDGESDISNRHTARFLAVCNQVKAKGIRVWVIAFSTVLTDDLIACASTSSSFTATDSTGLNQAFQNIAAEVGELRITQ